MLMLENAKAVHTALEIVLQHSKAKLEKVHLTEDREAGAALKDVCEVVNNTLEKITEIHGYCKHLHELPTRIDHTIEQKCKKELDDERKAALRPFTHPTT